jgi:hypothetical protein
MDTTLPCTDALVEKIVNAFTENVPSDSLRKPNKQLFVESDRIEPSAELNLTPFHNQKDPNLVIHHEKPEHRIVAYMKAQCLSNREISKRTGYTEPWISQITRQPWFINLLNEEFSKVGRDSLGGLIEASAKDAVETIIHLMSDAEKEDTKLKCALALLDRHLGKPIQKVEQKTETSVTYEDITGLDKELKEINDELRRIGAS